MSKAKQYQYAEEIELDIARARLRRRKLIADLESQQSLVALTDMGTVERKHAEEEADKISKQIERLEKRRIKQLSKTLAEFNTIPLPGHQQEVSLHGA